MRFRSQAEVIGFHIGWDVADVRENDYQATRYYRPNIYTIGEKYVCATNGQYPRHKDWKWEQRDDQVLKDAGWTVWMSTKDEE